MPGKLLHDVSDWTARDPKRRAHDVTPRSHFPRLVRLSSSVVFALLFLLFNTAYILTPYWRLARQPAAQLAALALLWAFGAIWAHVASAPLRIPVRGGARAIAVAAGILACMLALNIAALAGAFPLRGDEDHHVNITIFLVNQLWRRGHILPLLFGAFFAIHACAPRRGRALGFRLLSSAIVIVVQYVAAPLMQASCREILRYPFLGKYISAAPVVILGRFFEHTPEAAYRLTPFAAMYLLALYAAFRIKDRRVAPRILMGVAVGTMPAALYYSSILYLEPLALAAMTIVLCDRRLWNAGYARIRTVPAWTRCCWPDLSRRPSCRF
jgi:hypothetical protein